MKQLTFVKADDGAVIVASETGEQYSLDIDEALTSAVRQQPSARRVSGVSPAEVQRLIRAGHPLEEVARLTQADIEDVRRFEGPVLAEREFILESAMRVTIVLNPSDSHSHHSSFGAVISDRLTHLGASNVRWSSWRDEVEGWMVALEFVANSVAHHALWSYDHKKFVLEPRNTDATQLSKNGQFGDTLIPKLRAVATGDSEARFDSGAFETVDDEPIDSPFGQQPSADSLSGPTLTAVEDTPRETVVLDETHFAQPQVAEEARNTIEEAAIAREQSPVDFGQTADLLDALRRRRGERLDDSPLVDTAPYTPDQLNDAPEPSDSESENEGASEEAVTPPPPSAKGKRAQMPSWDDIVFGTKGDEE